MMEQNPFLRLPVQFCELVSRWRGGQSGGPPLLLLPSAAYKKIALLLDFVEVHAETGSPQSFLQAVESFGSGVGQWLKVAADTKAQLLQSALGRRRCWSSDACAEFGTFVGYTAVRLAHWAAGPSPAPGRSLSLEVDAIHALLTRHHLSLVRLIGIAEVWIGQALDLVPRLAEDLGAPCLGLAFMDHRGTKFHSDLARLERHGALLPGFTLVCDNVLKPGAPLCLWLVSRRPGAHAATSWSMNEFAHWNSEDWMLVSGHGRRAGECWTAAQFARDRQRAGSARWQWKQQQQ
uniref:catechol O-methyltransferase n=1 Tax=Alexandrium monilatum TaxID=311494 RepID=A0A6T1FZR8_9DINO|mmetsp:Transcript_12445/g.38383  ORF Transcript_12445/g.38383 Transcript_12445/m.38383 type:complete len:291 (-) Transcript_12445:9-881(-)